MLEIESAIAGTRNFYLHDNKSTPSIEDIEQFCVAAESVAVELFASGLHPVLFSPEQRDGDAYGRTRVTFLSESGDRLVLNKNAMVSVGGFPLLSQPQIIVACARFRDTGELLRFRDQHDSTFQEMWKDFPRRAVVNKRSMVSKSDVEA